MTCILDKDRMTSLFPQFIQPWVQSKETQGPRHSKVISDMVSHRSQGEMMIWLYSMKTRLPVLGCVFSEVLSSGQIYTV